MFHSCDSSFFIRCSIQNDLINAILIIFRLFIPFIEIKYEVRNMLYRCYIIFIGVFHCQSSLPFGRTQLIRTMIVTSFSHLQYLWAYQSTCFRLKSLSLILYTTHPRWNKNSSIRQMFNLEVF